MPQMKGGKGGAHTGPIKPLAKSGAKGGKGAKQPPGPPSRHMKGGGHQPNPWEQQVWRPSFMGAASRKRFMELLGQLPGGKGNGRAIARKANDEEEGQSKAAKKRKRAAAAEDDEAAGEPKAAAEGDEAGLPQDVPIFINLPDDEMRPDKLDQTSSDQALVVSWGGVKKKGFYSQAERALQHLLGDAHSEVEYHDDPVWETFPTIGKVLKGIANKEECMTIAVCNSRDVWAIGVGMRGQARWGAAKAALAATVAMQTIDTEGALPEEFIENFPSTVEFVEEAKTAKEIA